LAIQPGAIVVLGWCKRASLCHVVQGLISNYCVTVANLAWALASSIFVQTHGLLGIAAHGEAGYGQGNAVCSSDDRVDWLWMCDDRFYGSH